MDDADQGTRSLALRGAARFMRPIVRFLLKAGVTHADFSDLCKAVYVDVASNDYGIRGRKANNSRIAILTGLGRKQVRLQLDILAGEQFIGHTQMSPATRVISAWHEDRAFLDANAQPLVLSLDGPDPSFATLARKYAGDLPVNALIKELQRVNAVVDTDDGRLQIVSRSFLTAQLDPDHIRILSTQLQDLGATIVHNLAPASDADRRMQRLVVNENMTRAKAREFQRYATDETQKLLERFDGWLTQNEVPIDKRENKKTTRTGVGVYYFCDD